MMSIKNFWRFLKRLVSRSPGPELPPLEISKEVELEVEKNKTRRGPGF